VDYYWTMEIGNSAETNALPAIISAMCCTYKYSYDGKKYI